eukprot:390160_1
MSSFVNAVAKVIKTPDGLDKMQALLEKPAKILLYMLQTGKLDLSNKKDMIARLTAFSTNVMMARGINRLFSGSLSLSGLINTSKNSDAPDFVRYTQMCIALGWCAFFYYDNKIFFGLSGLIKLQESDYGHCGLRASQIWLFCLGLTLVLHVLHVQSLDSTDDDKENQKLIKQTKLKIIEHLMFIVCAARGSGLVSFNDGLHEVLMLGSALVGIRRILLP